MLIWNGMVLCLIGFFPSGLVIVWTRATPPGIRKRAFAILSMTRKSAGVAQIVVAFHHE